MACEAGPTAEVCAPGWQCGQCRVCPVSAGPAAGCPQSTPACAFNAPPCRQRGQRVIGETVASAISMDESRMWDPDFKASGDWLGVNLLLLCGGRAQ